MTKLHEIRADYDADTIVVYQAYAPAIADAALAAQRFVPPFSFSRMTWIKPSFLWLMHRSNWGRKPGQDAARLLPRERPYPVDPTIGRRPLYDWASSAPEWARWTIGVGAPGRSSRFETKVGDGSV